MALDGRKIKGTVHWVSAKYCDTITVREYDRLFTQANVFDLPENTTYMDIFNKNSIKVHPNAKAELSLADAKPGTVYQFVRVGYFTRDSKDNNSFNLTVGLKDSFKAK